MISYRESKLIVDVLIEIIYYHATNYNGYIVGELAFLAT